MAKRNNKNASGKRVEDRIVVTMSISVGNTLRPLFVAYLKSIGEEPTPGRIRRVAAGIAYGAWLDRVQKYEEKGKEE